MKAPLPSLLLLLALLWAGGGRAQHTFSIVAVDPTNGQVSAGATCLSSSDCGGCGGAIIISGLVPGRGAINAQATVCLPNSNLNLGLNRLAFGYSAQQTLDDLLAIDPCTAGDTSNRQYGIVDFDSLNNPRAVGFTGSAALNYANHVVGPNYSIQGNILIGPHVLDSLLNGFTNTPGPLCEKLMAALYATRIPGADSRCLANGTSSKSAFIRIANPGDTLGTFWMDLNVPQVPVGMEPIDSLKTLFEEFKNLNGLPATPRKASITVYPNPSHGLLTVDFRDLGPIAPELILYAPDGRELQRFTPDPGARVHQLDLAHLARRIPFTILVYRDVEAGMWESKKIVLQP